MPVYNPLSDGGVKRKKLQERNATSFFFSLLRIELTTPRNVRWAGNDLRLSRGGFPVGEGIRAGWVVARLNQD
jgi:hypothetical protein